MVKWAMVIDLDKCTACQTCTFACLAENNQPAVGPIEARKRRVHSWNQILCFDIESVKVPIPRPCMQCEIPACVKVCPTGARFYYDKGGVVLQSYDRCIGCRQCMGACPYNANYFRWMRYPPQDVVEFEEYRNPDFVVFPGLGRVGPSPEIIGVVEKCTFCFHKLVKLRDDLKNGVAGGLSEIFQPGTITWDTVGEAVELLMRYLIDPTSVHLELEGWEISYLPACVASCPARARIFGNIEDPNSLVSTLARSGRAFKLLEDLGTSPKVIYLSPRR